MQNIEQPAPRNRLCPALRDFEALKRHDWQQPNTVPGRKWSKRESGVSRMERHEWGHDSPVFEVISGLKLSSHLKCYPSSVRGRLTHTAHIKALFLDTHAQTHYSKTILLINDTIYSFLSSLPLYPHWASCVCRKYGTVTKHTHTHSKDDAEGK